MPWILEMSRPTFWNTIVDWLCVHPSHNSCAEALLSSVAMSDGISQEGIKVERGHIDGALIWWECPQKKRHWRTFSRSLCTHTSRKGHVRIQWEVGCLQARKRAPSPETYLDGPASRTSSLQNYEREKKEFCCLSRPVCDDLLWQPGHSNQSLLSWPQSGNQEGYSCKFIPLVWGFLPEYCFLSILQPNLMEQCENYQKCATHAHTTLLTTVSQALLLLFKFQKGSGRNFTAKASTVDPWATWKLICI